MKNKSGKTCVTGIMNSLQSFFTTGKMAVMFTVLYIVNAIPLLILGFYNFPSADDFSEGSYCYKVWENSHSIILILKEALNSTLRSWWNWMGYYGYMFLSSFTPVVFGMKMYKITTFIMLGILTASTIYLIYVLLVRAAGLRKDLTICVAMITLLLSVERLYGANELLYWFGGAVNYTLFFAFAEILVGLVISLYIRQEREGKKPVLSMILISLFAFLTAGGNYLSALSGGLALIFIILVLALQRKIRKNSMIWMPTVVYFVGFILSIAAPGNSVRSALLNGYGPIKSIFISLHYFFEICIGEMSGWTLPAALLLLVPFFWKMSKDTDFTFPYPVIVVTFLGGLCAANFAPPIYAEGNVEAGRIMGTLYLQYILLAVLSEGYCLGWLHGYLKRHGYRDAEGAEDRNHFSSASLEGIIAVCLMTTFAAAMSVKAVPEYFATTSAVTDLVTGKAQEYARQWGERVSVLEDKSVTDPVFEAFTVKPVLLFYIDGNSDSNDWLNQCYCKFYDKNSVTILEPEDYKAYIERETQEK